MMDESKTVPELLRELAAAEHGIELADMFRGLAERVEREYIERPRFEDGALVEVGDKVLWNGDESKRVEEINVELWLEGECGTYSSVLKRPIDTLERIEEDAKEPYGFYWGCAGVLCHDCPAMVDGKKPWERYATDGSCEKAQTLDLLQRQRALLERGQA